MLQQTQTERVAQKFSQRLDLFLERNIFSLKKTIVYVILLLLILNLESLDTNS